MGFQNQSFFMGIFFGGILVGIFLWNQEHSKKNIKTITDTASVSTSSFVEREELPLYTEEHLDVSDFVALPYEQTGGVFSIPMTVVSSQQEAKEMWMIFDTGASISTLDSKTLSELGITKIPSNAPTLQFRTANGLRESPIVLVDQIWMGGYLVGPVTFAICESCAKDDVRGLLGLNISDSFLITIDTLHHELLLQPRKKQHLRSDIQHWIEISSAWGIRGLEIEVLNVSPKTIYDLRIQLKCNEMLRIDEIPAQATHTVIVSNLSCSGASVGTIRGRFLQSQD